MGTHRGLSIVHHAGAVMGGSCQMLKVADHGLDIIVMTNGLGSMAVSTLVDAIIDRCVPGLPAVPPSVDGPVVTGTFYSAATGRRIGLEEVDGGPAIRIDSMTLPATRDADGALSVPLVPTDMRVTPAPDGGSLTLAEYGRSDTLFRIEPPAGVSARPPEGRYAAEAAGLCAEVAVGGDDATLTLTGALGAMDYALSAVGPDLWEGRATGALPLALLIEVDRDGSGFRLTSGRTQWLSFARQP